MKPEIVVQRIREIVTYCIEIQAILDKFKNNYNLIQQKCYQMATEVIFVQLGKGHAISLEEFDRQQKEQLTSSKSFLIKILKEIAEILKDTYTHF